MAIDISVDATPSAPATTKGVEPSGCVAHEVAERTQEATDTPAGTSSQADVVPQSTVIEVETNTLSATQIIDEDDDVQIVGKTRRPDSPSVMMPVDAVPPTNPTTGPLLNLSLT